MTSHDRTWLSQSAQCRSARRRSDCIRERTVVIVIWRRIEVTFFYRILHCRCWPVFGCKDFCLVVDRQKTSEFRFYFLSIFIWQGPCPYFIRWHHICSVKNNHDWKVILSAHLPRMSERTSREQKKERHKGDVEPPNISIIVRVRYAFFPELPGNCDDVLSAAPFRCCHMSLRVFFWLWKSKEKGRKKKEMKTFDLEKQKKQKMREERIFRLLILLPPRKLPKWGPFPPRLR